MVRPGRGKTRTIRTAAAAVTVLLCSVLPFAGATPASAAACDDVLVPGSAWIGGIGVDIRSNGPYTGTQASCRPMVTDLSGLVPQWGFGWQCVELVTRLYMTRRWISRARAATGSGMYGLAAADVAS